MLVDYSFLLQQQNLLLLKQPVGISLLEQFGTVVAVRPDARCQFDELNLLTKSQLVYESDHRLR
jgi:hypothetical protein